MTARAENVIIAVCVLAIVVVALLLGEGWLR